MVWAYHVFASEYHCDDLTWLKATDAGLLNGLASPHPFDHFRPTFYVWIWFLRALRLTSPAALGIAGMVLQLALLVLVYLFMREWMSTRGSGVVTAIVAIHPVRQSLWFWASTQIDALCLVFTVASLAVATKTLKLGSSPLRLLSVAGLTLLAALAKETAFALPLAILLLPTKTSVKARIPAVVASGVAVLVAVLWSAAVLDGSGRGGDLILHANLRALARYPVQLVLPLDWFGLSYRYVGTDGYRFVWRASWLIGLGLAGVFAVAVWLRRSEPWARLSVVFFCWAGLAWIASESDRSIGLGALAAAAMLGGFTERWSRRGSVAVLMLVLCIVWAPRWWVYLQQWRAADQHTVALDEALTEWRQNVEPDQHFVVIGLPYTIGEMAEPAAVYELDDCSSAATMALHANPNRRGPTGELSYPKLTIALNPPAMFGECTGGLFVDLQRLPDAIITERQCDPVGYLQGFSIDVKALAREARHKSCSGATPLLWTGSDLAPLEDGNRIEQPHEELLQLP